MACTEVDVTAPFVQDSELARVGMHFDPKVVVAYPLNLTIGGIYFCRAWAAVCIQYIYTYVYVYLSFLRGLYSHPLTGVWFVSHFGSTSGDGVRPGTSASFGGSSRQRYLEPSCSFFVRGL